MLILVALTLVAGWDQLRGETIVGLDSATQFYPWYAFLGESLRSGRLPGWNPHQFSGGPFAADPLSGWTYLPAMLLFTALPLSAAAAGYQLLHPLIAALSAYALGRSLGMSVAGGLLAAVAYGFSGFISGHNACCFAFAALAAWLPLTMLGTERAIKARTWEARGLWWGVSGLALSQILASWLGQGSYYALLTLGGYVAYRTLLAPPLSARSPRRRLAGLLLHGTAPLVFGFGLAAAGLLPRVGYNALSNLAGGYPSSEVGVGGWSVLDWAQVVEPTYHYAGVVTLALALVAVPLARGRFATPYFATLSLGALVLSGHGPTPLHAAMDLLPSFTRLHAHLPERVMSVFFLGPALLAGATLTRLGQPGRVAAPCARPRVARLCISALLIMLVFADLLAGSRAVKAEYLAREAMGSIDKLEKIDLTSYYEPTGAGQFLRWRASSEGEEPFRFFGYSQQRLAYTQRWAVPGTTALEVNNRAISLGLQDVQGYNPIHVARYDELLVALNGASQNYHNADVFERGVTSPLLNLLNARYIVVPAARPTQTSDLVYLERTHPTIYEDDAVRVLENREALPRAWIVHAARHVEPGQALELLASGEVDPRRTALLEAQDLPELGEPRDTSTDRASIASYEADRIRLRTTTEAPGLLVLSEVYYPAWKAYVDGRPVPLHVADHVLRAVPVPAGEHEVELRYESTALVVGVAISIGTYALLVLLGCAALVRRRHSVEQA